MHPSGQKRRNICKAPKCCIYTVYTFHCMFLFIDWCIWLRFAVCMFCQSFLAADWISRRSSKKCGDPFQCEKPRWDEMKPMTKQNQQVCSFCRNSWQHHSIIFASLSSIPKRLIKIDQNELQFLLSNMIFKNIDLLFTVLFKKQNCALFSNHPSPNL